MTKRELINKLENLPVSDNKEVAIINKISGLYVHVGSVSVEDIIKHEKAGKFETEEHAKCEDKVIVLNV